MSTTGRDAELRRAYRTLAERDAVLAALVAEYGRPSPFTWHYDGRTGDSKFAAMLLHILGQQISTAVAFHMYDRISALTGGIPTAPEVLKLTPEQLRGAGITVDVNPDETYGRFAHLNDPEGNRIELWEPPAEG